MTDPKKALRDEARARRTALAKANPDFAAAIADHADALPRVGIVGGYMALPGEADPKLLLEKFLRHGASLAFPRVVAKDIALEFHLWHEGQILVPGAFGISEPGADWPVARPQLLLVPLLAFDARGHRLGYGGGFYDRTLENFPDVTTIGIAFAGQEITQVPHGPHDRSLDMMLTEKGLRHFRA
jgi:5-formyltetrahydrofolate cyclo-ligase